MSQQTSTVVMVTSDDDFREHVDDIMKAYGVAAAVVNPKVMEDEIQPKSLYFTDADGLWVRTAQRMKYSFPVRFITFKVAMEMVAINKEDGFA